jgi:hypothetical protein
MPNGSDRLSVTLTTTSWLTTRQDRSDTSFAFAISAAARHGSPPRWSRAAADTAARSAAPSRWCWRAATDAPTNARPPTIAQASSHHAAQIDAIPDSDLECPAFVLLGDADIGFRLHDRT